MDGKYRKSNNSIYKHECNEIYTETSKSVFIKDSDVQDNFLIQQIKPILS